MVQAFHKIVESLIEFENFTNISINGDDVLLRGERVIKQFTLYRLYKIMSCKYHYCFQIFRNQYEGRTFSVTGMQGMYYYKAHVCIVKCLIISQYSMPVQLLYKHG